MKSCFTVLQNVFQIVVKNNFFIRIKEKQLACIIPKALLLFSHLRNMLTAASSLSLCIFMRKGMHN